MLRNVSIIWAVLWIAPPSSVCSGVIQSKSLSVIFYRVFGSGGGRDGGGSDAHDEGSACDDSDGIGAGSSDEAGTRSLAVLAAKSRSAPIH